MPKNPHANFTPVLDGYSGIGAFRFWCQTALPLTYDDSLSYYELLNKVVNYLNHTNEDLTAVESNTSALAEAYNKLQKYVNDYFDDLDVKAELRNVLDAMAEDGTLDALLDPLVENHLPGIVEEKIDGVVAEQINGAVAGQIDESVADQLPALVDEGIPEEVSNWLKENVKPVGSAVMVDSTLSISGSAADAKVTGDKLGELKAQFVYPTSKTVAIAQGYWAFVDGKHGDSDTWCKTDFLDKDIILKTTTIKMFIIAYDAHDGTYIGGWNGNEFSTTFNQNGGVREINISEWLDSYPNYRFRVDFNNGTAVITPADVYSVLVVESISNKNIERIDNDIEQVEDNIEEVEKSVDGINSELINKMAKHLIIECLKNVAWTTQNGEDFIDELSYTLGIKNLLYSITKHHFDGAENGPINTGVILFDTDKDFTILLEIVTAIPQVGDWAIIQGYSEADVSGLLIGKGYGANITTNFRFMNKVGLESNVAFTSNYIGTTKIAIRHTSGSNSALFTVKTGTDEPVEVERTRATFTASNAPIYIGGANTGRQFRGTISCNIYDVVMSDTLIATFMEVGF